MKDAKKYPQRGKNSDPKQLLLAHHSHVISVFQTSGLLL